MNTFGRLFRITTFGESHGPAIGVVVDGCPAGLTIERKDIQSELDRRRPGQSGITTPRKEKDQVEILSGIFENKTTGAPIALLIRNEDALSEDYDQLKNIFRPNHADYTYIEKYGRRDYRGSGRASARETANWVAAGAIARQLLKQYHISVYAFVKQVGPVICNKNWDELDLNMIEANEVRCPDNAAATEMIKYIESMRDAGDSAGGIIQCVIHGIPAGLGEPVFNKLNAMLAGAMMSINAVKGFELGLGFNSVIKKGSEYNDAFIMENEQVTTATNHSGGIQGGISNGRPVWFQVAFKPVSTIAVEQTSVDIHRQPVKFSAAGRHDPCVVPRAVPIVEAMSALVIADAWLMNKNNRV